VHVLYVIQFFGLQICSFAVQILAGSALIQMMTGLGFHLVAVILVLTALSYSLMGGVRASVVTDFVQMSLILVIALITVPWVVAKAGGLHAVTTGFGGVSGDYGNIFDPWVAYSFGIPVTIGLLSGPIGDQMHWQRAYALRSDKDVIKTFVLGALIFVLVPVTLSILGFVAANKELSANWTITSTQLIGPITVAHLLPGFMLVIFSVMLLSGLCSTLDSILCAASALATVDLAGASQSGDDHDTGKVLIARIGMLGTAASGLGIACIPNLQIVHLFLFYGTWRASTMIPTILSLFWGRLNSNAVFAAILASLVFGAPIYAAGAILKNPHLSVTGSVLVVLIGLGVCAIWSQLSPASHEMTTGETRSEFENR
jgi:Na+/proline symporter